MYIIPFVIVLASLAIVKKTSHKPYCIMIGILCTMVCSVYQKKMSVYQSISTLLRISGLVLRDNSSLFITLLLFGILIKIITESGAIEELSKVLNCLIKGKTQFFILLIVCALAASVDDYLACFLLTTVLGTCYSQFNLSKTEICFFINTVVVACCSMVPVSTWTPVITNALVSEKETLLGEFYYLRYCFSYFIFFSITVIFVILILKKSNKNKQSGRKKLGKAKSNSILILVIDGLILYITYIITRNCAVPAAKDNSILISCCCALAFSHIAFRKSEKIRNYNIFLIYVEGVKDMWGLVKFLFVLWIYTDCLQNMLQMNETILHQVAEWSIHVNFLPFIIFVFSGVVSYCTGSVFATVRLLVPISLAIARRFELDSVALCLTAAAAINGSLLASVSPLSDTLAICCDKLKQDSRYMYIAHLPYSCIMICGTAISYLVAGYLLKASMFVTIIGPIVLICPLIILCVIDVPFCYSIIMFGNRKICYLLSLSKIDTVKKTIRRYAKSSHVYKNRFKNGKYASSMPIRRRPVYRLKIC